MISVRDRRGKRIHPGDIVACRATYYIHMNYGDTFEVLDTDSTCIVIQMKCFDEPYRYKACNFEVVEPREEDKNMLHIAVRIDTIPKNHPAAPENYLTLAVNANSVAMHAEATLAAINEWVSIRIRHDPNEQWLLLAPSYIAETSAPPVRFRKV